MDIYFWEICFCICSLWKDRNKCKITSKTTLLTWEYSSAQTEADCWNAQVKLHGVWKSVVWMVLQQPSKSPRPSEVAFGHGKGGDVVAPIPTDLCGACEHRAPPRAQPGCGMAVGGVWRASVGHTVVSVPPELQCCTSGAGTVPCQPGCPWGTRVTAPCMSHRVFTHRHLDVLLSHLCTHSQPRDPPLLCLALFE